VTARHCSTVVPGDFDSATVASWTRVGTVDDVPLLEGRSVEVEGRRIAVFRLPGGWAAIDAA
jgi:nitrite reductase (NADH) small subunit